MASASVSAAAGLERADCLCLVGRRWANSPITAHPQRRMQRIPLRVVPWQALVAQIKCDRKRWTQVATATQSTSREESCGEHPCDISLRPRTNRVSGSTGTYRPARLVYSPATGAVRLARIKSD